MKILKIIPSPKLEIYQDSKNEWRWNIKVNGEIIGASSEGYINRQDCVDNIKNLKKRIEYLERNDLIV
ncbi:YegP family protein [Yeosuana sp.]|uniref:YegP family protein n=1 Tax=Yeosuana sp. TaxID=2529388 RepID=UPI00404B65F2